MGWFDDVGAGTYKTGISTVGAGVPSIFYDRRFLELLTEELQLAKFAQLRPLPEGNGTTIEFTRPRPLSPNVTALTEGVNPLASKLYFQKVKATLKEYGDWAQITSLAQQAHISQDVLGAVETFAAQAGASMDLLLAMELNSCGIYPMRADLDATKEYTGTFTTVTSTTSFADTAVASNSGYGDANDHMNQSIITVLSGPAKGESRPVNDYATSGGVYTLAIGFDMTPEVGDSYRVCTPTSIAAADDLSYANLKAAKTVLTKYHAQKFNGLYACVLSADQWKNLADDTDWKAVQTYKDRTTGIEQGSAPTFGGFGFHETTQPFGFPIAAITETSASYGPGSATAGANYSASGAIQTALCIGKNSFGATSFRKKGSPMKPPVHVKYPNKYDKSDPLDRWVAVGWVIEACFKSLYSLHTVGLWTYGT